MLLPIFRSNFVRMVSLVFFVIPAWVQASPASDKRVAQAIQRILGDHYPSFSEGMIERLKAKASEYSKLLAHKGSLVNPMTELLIKEARLAYSKQEYPIRLLPGLRILVAKNRDRVIKPPFPIDMDEVLSRRIFAALDYNRSIFDHYELARSLQTVNEQARYSLTILGKDPTHPIAQATFSTLVQRFDVRQTGRERDLMEIARAIIKYYPEQWANHEKQQYLVEFWNRFDRFYRFYPNLSPRAQMEISEFAYKIPPRERVYLHVLLKFHDDVPPENENWNKYTLRTQAAEELFDLQENGKGDIFSEILKTTDVDLRFIAAPGDYRNFIVDRARLMKDGKRARIGAYLFETLLDQNPDLAKEIAPVYFEHEFWPELLKPIDGIYPARGTSGYKLTRNNPRAIQEYRDLYKWDVIRDVDRLQRLARYFAVSKNPAVVTARDRVAQDLWKVGQSERWTLATSATFKILFKEGHPGRARVEFLTRAESGTKALSEDFYRQGRIYLNELLRLERFETEYLREKYFRAILGVLDWNQLPEAVEPILGFIDSLSAHPDCGPAERISFSMTYANLVKAHVMINRPHVSEIQDLAYRAAVHLSRDLKALENHDLSLELAELLTDDIQSNREVAWEFMEGFERFQRWVEVMNAEHQLTQVADLQQEITKINRMLSAQFPNILCNRLMKIQEKLERDYPTSGNLFELNYN